mmetsp:Transcript_23860/g.32806  ORF Transcript_23860/g.32806 Transcript_23860/m.32806 type:complete len:202 (-) Transcript_23860:106-711(-)|eukprot:CAMPEP_0196581044 /NCGR_PEP_ID=MMETSP1081-20130531/32124_1 /TAXON_ID=36882 /ORGANISM="Pyramimonas amylifera, Strain CCMP720" /LENGTH=201 /DNA_ID=CAMNT_0041901129 /DNA_START=84 /DNA_END=689 /DNA_ORIENTATION=+
MAYDYTFAKLYVETAFIDNVREIPSGVSLQEYFTKEGEQMSDYLSRADKLPACRHGCKYKGFDVSIPSEACFKHNRGSACCHNLPIAQCRICYNVVPDGIVCSCYNRRHQGDVECKVESIHAVGTGWIGGEFSGERLFLVQWHLDPSVSERFEWVRSAEVLEHRNLIKTFLKALEEQDVPVIIVQPKQAAAKLRSFLKSVK